MYYAYVLEWAYNFEYGMLTRLTLISRDDYDWLKMIDPNQLGRVWQDDVIGPNQLGQVRQLDVIGPNKLGRELQVDMTDPN